MRIFCISTEVRKFIFETTWNAFTPHTTSAPKRLRKFLNPVIAKTTYMQVCARIFMTEIMFLTIYKYMYPLPEKW